MPAIHTVENLFIPMPDGVALAARLWLPDGAEASPVPAILEYLPYRKRDGTRAHDETMHGHFAGRGYASIRVDLRGSGDSEGFLDDEFLPTEQDDACSVIAWLADQPWCDGSVGMIGKSWGGFNALQVAARRPSALKAIVTVCSTDDRYADDVHFMGGCLLNDNLWWGSAMMTWQALPPTPALARGDWREAWADRIAHLPFFPAIWASHPLRDAYWRQGSVCEDWSALDLPVFAVGGWADGYSNAVPRLLQHLPGPRLGLVGPWAHAYPHEGLPGPAIAFLDEATRWWDHWLKGIDTGIMAQPMLRAFMQDGAEASEGGSVSGRWIGETTWPSRLVTRRPMFLSPGQLWWRPGPAAELQVRSPLWCGATAGEWMAVGLPGEAPADQRLDDGLSLVFDSKELADRTEILGAAELVLELASDAPAAQICVRLSDVAPDGTARRVAWQILDLTHRHGHDKAEPLEPGRFEIVRIKLSDCAHSFPAGHRIRLAVSTAAWPTAWPAPNAATLAIRTDDSALILPVRRPRREDAAITLAPVDGEPPPTTTPERLFALDVLAGTSTMTVEGDAFGAGPVAYGDIATEYGHRIRRDFSIRDGDPSSAMQTVTHSCFLACDGHRFRVALTARMSERGGAYQMTARLEVQEDDRPFAAREFEASIPRPGA